MLRWEVKYIQEKELLVSDSMFSCSHNSLTMDLEIGKGHISCIALVVESMAIPNVI